MVVHEYFRINPDLVLDIVDNQLRPLKDKLNISERNWTPHQTRVASPRVRRGPNGLCAQSGH